MGLDAAAFDALYAANADRVYSTAYRLLGDADAAADVVQDAFLKAFTAADEIREPAAWLTTVARNNALNVLRRQGRLAPLAEEATDEDEHTAPPLTADEPAVDPLHAAATADALDIVDELLASLSPDQRTALLLFHVQEQPISAIADVLGRTVNATTVFLHRSRAALRLRYADRVYARTNIPAECRSFRPQLLAHVEGKPASAEYLEHLAIDPICQAVETELRGMGRVLGVLPIIPAPTSLQASIETALTLAVGSGAAGSGATGTTSAGGTPAAASSASQASHGVGGFLGTSAGKVAAGVAVVAIVAAGALVALQQPPAPAPVRLAAAPVLSAFDSHNCAIRRDRTLVCWGDSNNRKLEAPEGEFVAISAGHTLSCAISPAATISCWGYDGIDNETAVPAGTFTAVATGAQHSCAIRTDGTLACWGWNLHGQADAPAGTFAAVAAGREHTCAIRSDGSVTCWGNNEYGEADPPTGTFRYLAAGQWRTCGIRDDGSLACWGAVAGWRDAVPSGTYTSVALGTGFHACAVRDDGGIDCWAEGGGWPGTQAPDGTFVAVATGLAHSCGLTEEGTMACWGNNHDDVTDVPPGPYGPVAPAVSPR